MANDGYLFRVSSDEPHAPTRTNTEYWYANISDRQAAITAVMMAATAVVVGASVEMVSYISQETFQFLKIGNGEIRRD